MRRRFFLRSVLSGLAGTTLLYNCDVQGSEKLFNESGKKKITIGICTDVHMDLFPNVEARLSEFVKAADEKRVDFIIHLGDFCFPKEENKNFMSIWNRFNGDRYHVLGNHDMDECSKEEILEFWGADKTKPYYSFDFESFHFIVLDPNNIFKNGQYIPYYKGNYFSEGDNINHITPEQLAWLREDLSNTSKPTVIFSHQPLSQIGSKKADVMSNGNEMLKILRDANSGITKKVIACFSGHLHKNWHVEEHSVNHIQINSMCYLWVGDNYMCETRYPAEIQEQYPLIKKMIPYRDALYCFVELDLDKEEIRITGKSSEFIPPGPQELGIGETGIFAPSPCIDSRIIKF